MQGGCISWPSNPMVLWLILWFHFSGFSGTAAPSPWGCSRRRGRWVALGARGSAPHSTHPAHPRGSPGSRGSRPSSSFQGPWIACKRSLPVPGSFGSLERAECGHGQVPLLSCVLDGSSAAETIFFQVKKETLSRHKYLLEYHKQRCSYMAITEIYHNVDTYAFFFSFPKVFSISSLI